jgi:hypothetical protein
VHDHKRRPQPGREKDIDEVLQTTTVFANVGKGVHAKKEELQVWGSKAGVGDGLALRWQTGVCDKAWLRVLAGFYEGTSWQVAEGGGEASAAGGAANARKHARWR